MGSTSDSPQPVLELRAPEERWLTPAEPSIEKSLLGVSASLKRVAFPLSACTKGTSVNASPLFFGSKSLRCTSTCTSSGQRAKRRVMAAQDQRNRSVPVSSDLRKVSRCLSCRVVAWWVVFPEPGWPPLGSRRFLSRPSRCARPCPSLDVPRLPALAQGGVSLYKISHFLGNSPSICQRHYSALRTTSPLRRCYV